MQVKGKHVMKKTRIGGERRCSAHRRDGQVCRNAAVRGRAVCRMHGAGSPKRNKPGGRPPTHGLYSVAVAASLQSRLNEMRSDPEITDGLNDIARIRALCERAEELLGSEEAAYVQNLGKNPSVDAAMRGRLLNWYECLVKLSAETIASIDRYYAALEKRAGGVALDAVRAGMIGVARVLDECVTDESLRQTICDRIGAAFERIVVAGPKSIG